MTTPTQRQRELADRILRMLSARIPILEHSQYEDAVAQLLADAMNEPTQKQKQLAEAVINALSAPGSVKNNVNVLIVAQLLADEGEKRREMLRRKVKQAKKRAQEWQAYLDELDGVE